MQPDIHIFGITLKSFGIVFACGFIAAGAILWRRLRELGKPPDYAYEMTFAALIGGLVGSRVYYVIQNYSVVKHDLLGSLFSGSGLVWYGGVIGGAIAVVAWAAWTPTDTLVATVRPWTSTGGLCAPVVRLPWQNVQVVAHVEKPLLAWHALHERPDEPPFRSVPWQVLQPARPVRLAW